MDIHHKKREASKGITMIELMMTLAILGIITSLAIPSFSKTINNSRLTTNANQLVASLNLARSEAIKRNTTIYVANIENEGQNWDNGWNVFIDENSNEIFNENSDTLLKTYPSLTNNYTLRTGENISSWVAYKPSGLYETSTGRLSDSFRLCTMKSDTNDSRRIILNSIGRARITKNDASSCP